MEKVKINKVVAGWIENAKNKKLQETENLMYDVLKYHGHELKGNIDIVMLAHAIEHGYEVLYEFKVGDLIKNHHNDVLEVVSDTYEINRYTRRISDVNHDSVSYKLVCKRENREDSKCWKI